MRKKLSILATAMAATLATSSVSAIQFDGFLTAGAAWHDDENKNRYIGSLGDRGIQNDASFETDTRFGLQISSDIAENMSVVSQLLGTGVNGNFDAIVEWAYVDYKATDWLSIHAGKIKQPVYLVNDYVEVGYAYPWIRPPVEVYYLNNPLNTVNGIEFLLQFPVGPGVLSLQPYVGSNRDDIPNTGGAGFFEAERIRGIDIKYSGKGFTAHASSFSCDVKVYGNMNDVPTAFGFPVDIDLNGKGKCEVNSAGFNVDMANVVVYAEWQNRLTNETLARPFGDQEAWYTTVGYRFGKWLPHITYASIDGEASTVGLATGAGAVECGQNATGGTCDLSPMGGPVVPSGTGFMNFPTAIQTSVTYGVRYEINDSAALKIEHSVVDVEQDMNTLMDANQGLNFGLFDNSFTGAAPTEKVGVTSIALDVVF
ncbi:MAG: hypothetical protein KAJ92_03455 [Gammaproteobacteria bacterium]|nr:hypothetical protein [Gammaproteobacteria bacterium]